MERLSRDRRVVELTRAAALDLASIDNATATMWCNRQADLYTAFLQEVVYELATIPKWEEGPCSFPTLKPTLPKFVDAAQRAATGLSTAKSSTGVESLEFCTRPCNGKIMSSKMKIRVQPARLRQHFRTDGHGLEGANQVYSVNQERFVFGFFDRRQPDSF